MKAYHFLPANYGLANLQRRHLKVATIPELNDPFELLCLDLSDPELRRAMRAWKATIGRCFGLLCFSRTWRNPVQWSHYADGHRGVCLGFEPPESNYVRDVIYSGRRSVEEARRLISDKTTDEETILRFLTTKYAHWHYEKELRVFLRLTDKDSETGLYFCSFSKELMLSEIIIGAESSVTRSQVLEALGTHEEPVTLRNARLAFRTYRVTTQHDRALWA